jgi:hypothetical protein
MIKTTIKRKIRSSKKQSKRSKKQSKKQRSKKQRSKKQRSRGQNGGIFSLQQLPTADYIPFGGDIVGNQDYPLISSDNNTPVPPINFLGGKRSYGKQPSYGKRGGYRKNKKRGGGLIPEQLVNTGRGISGFFIDKVNSYQGNPAQASYMPYEQPIEHVNSSSLIDLY